MMATRRCCRPSVYLASGSRQQAVCWEYSTLLGTLEVKLRSEEWDWARAWSKTYWSEPDLGDFPNKPRVKLKR